MAMRRAWNREELLLAFRLYCRTPFGRLHYRNPEIIQLARLMGRTSSAISMKACNFASLDPAQQERGITGLGNVSRDDRRLWDEFEQNAESVAAAAEEAYGQLVNGLSQGRGTSAATEPELEPPTGPTEMDRTVRVRRVQGFFRAAVLASYEGRCAISGIAIPELLNASHIIPWQQDIRRRADPRNGIALNTLYDRAFDRGLITFDESLRLVLSDRLKRDEWPQDALLLQHAFLDLKGQPLRLPARFTPDPIALDYHRRNVFN